MKMNQLAEALSVPFLRLKRAERASPHLMKKNSEASAPQFLSLGKTIIHFPVPERNRKKVFPSNPCCITRGVCNKLCYIFSEMRGFYA